MGFSARRVWNSITMQSTVMCCNRLVNLLQNRGQPGEKIGIERNPEDTGKTPSGVDAPFSSFTTKRIV